MKNSFYSYIVESEPIPPRGAWGSFYAYMYDSIGRLYLTPSGEIYAGFGNLYEEPWWMTQEQAEQAIHLAKKKFGDTPEEQIAIREARNERSKQNSIAMARAVLDRYGIAHD